jgi:mono/diheme cytochrome c family protein
MANPTSFVGALLGAGLAIAAGIGATRAQTSPPSAPFDPSLVTRGAYLAKAADCMPCHTSANDKQFAGGLKLDTPFGAIFSPNITPDRDTGIGRWTFEDFKNAVHAGIRADGSYLYPVMTYDAFTLITDDDLKALWAYFRSIPAIKQENRGNELNFPFNIRLTLLPWRWLFFTEGYYKSNPARGPQWNRGAYLVEALAHCSDCHTPRNFMGATIASKWLQGARIDQWYAPNISAESLRNINKWDKARLVTFLRKGAGNNSTALGPMQEVVHDSMSYLTEPDLDAMATFLLDLPPGAETPRTPVARKLAPDVEARAAKLYADNCATCHQAEGQGTANQIPPLAGNPAILAAKPFDILAAVLQGVPARDDIISMPSFAGSLGDQAVADLANYVRTSFGNGAPPNATPSMVASWRSTLSLPIYASASARTFDCPNVGQGGSASFDPSVIAALGRELGQRSVAYARLVATYQAQNPNAGLTDIVNNLVAAYCPVVAANASLSNAAKDHALSRFAREITSYVTSMSINETEPDIGVVWATPLGASLLEHDPSWQPTLTCPAPDKSGVPASLLDAAAKLEGKPDPNISSQTATGQANDLATQNPKAKLAEVANALILAYCQGVSRLSGLEPAQKTAAMTRYGEVVIEALQAKAATLPPAPIAAAAK